MNNVERNLAKRRSMTDTEIRNEKRKMKLRRLKKSLLLRVKSVVLWARGSDVNKRDVDGNTLLHKACEISDLGAIKLLLKLGANPNLQNNFGDCSVTLVKDRCRKVSNYFVTEGIIK